MKHSVLIVDDEPLARRGVALRRQTHKDLEVIGECTNGSEALEVILQRKPDLVFLDIQMPLMNGIEVVRSLPTGFEPFIIFLTAFDQYATHAVNANHPLGVAVIMSTHRQGGRTRLKLIAASKELAAQSMPKGNADTVHTTVARGRPTLCFQRRWHNQYMRKLERKLLSRKAPRKAS